MKKIILAICALALALGSSMPVSAATQTTTMPVSASIIAAVTVSVTSLSFGTGAPGASLYANSTITVNATAGTVYTVTLGAGLNLTDFRRVMSGATSGGSYSLYKDGAYTLGWGDSGYAGTYNFATGVAGTGTGANQALTVYGWLINDLTPGTYTDTVTVTVNY